MTDKWEIVENTQLTQEQRETAAAQFMGLDTLVFICKGDEWIGFGKINEENLRQAKVCMEALNGSVKN